MSLRVQWLVPFFVPRTLRPPWLEIYGLLKYWINSRLVFWKNLDKRKIIFELMTNRGRHRTLNMSRKIDSPWDRKCLGEPPNVESRKPMSRESESRFQSPTPDFSISSPGPESRIFCPRWPTLKNTYLNRYIDFVT